MVLLGGNSQTRAGEICLLSSAAMQSVFKQIEGDYERTSGHRLIIDCATMSAINQQVLHGETADDLVIGRVAAGIPTGMPGSEPVMEFLRFLSHPKAVAAIKAKGMEVE